MFLEVKKHLHYEVLPDSSAGYIIKVRRNVSRNPFHGIEAGFCFGVHNFDGEEQIGYKMKYQQEFTTLPALLRTDDFLPSFKDHRLLPGGGRYIHHPSLSMKLECQCQNQSRVPN